MNRLTRQEFQDRVEAVARARKIFGELTEGNITRAFEAYQVILAEQDREVIISTVMGNRPPSPLDQFERPKCLECGSDILFRPLLPNKERWKTMLECSNPQCMERCYSDMSIDEWVEEMRNASGPKQIETGQ